MLAAAEGHHECLSVLLAHGADVNKAEPRGVSAVNAYRGAFSIGYLLCAVLCGLVVYCTLYGN